ncbi:Vga family ABC-F type ribosomal protection protein [Alkalihalophilus lindianensis]|uniref:Vga family ABC-F type ribosomal protection protein n=1 Tax=Alkalihalophilus lindianensis TaxID=1630542 RepID=A0ABU3XDX4_9BACI|nr:Vga family ABC-F type ribosomal protection protein [Alkalihalophilus lindianensis]MDV2686076.1 Vga family ABC-F type ribosomal protection protein [Alkalihalophilus lindianensis]
MLLEATTIKVSIGDRLLIDVGHLDIQKGDRIGLVGKNGSGKTTLLKGLAGDISFEGGVVATYTTCELLPQLKRTDITKSGGEITQEYINKVLMKEPELLFADEPTTNLDTAHIEWLEKKLKNWKGAFVVVSHDRAFLDALCTKIWEINKGSITEYKGNYTAYSEQKKIEQEQDLAAYEKYEKKKRQLEEALKAKEQKAERATKTPKNVSKSEARITGAKPYFAKKQKKLQKTGKAIETRLEKLDQVEKPKEAPPLKMNLPYQETFTGRIMLRVEDVSGMVGKRVLWEKTSFYIRGGDKVAIIGPNGSGKTTLVKKIINEEEGIILSPSMKIGYFSQNLTILDPDKTILENVRSTSIQDETLIRTILARLHFFREDVHKPIHVLSGGERVKVALAKLFVSNCNTLILDEPTNYLDTEAVEALEALLTEYEGSVIFVSHDRRFIELVATRIVSFDHKKLEVFEGTYQQYQQHQPQETRDQTEDARMILDTKISEVLSRLSIDPSDELEKEFQKLLEEKRKL